MRNAFSFAVAVIVAVVGLAAAGNQGPGVNRVMREKLIRSQKILEAVVTSDWVGLETETRELRRLTDDPRWTVLNFPEYARHSADFKRTVADLHEAAAQRDLENTPKAYVAVTLSCVSCHRYLARARIAEPDAR
jgi:1-acyl-sn-glycerol-3-phosphate acyltransferase